MTTGIPTVSAIGIESASNLLQNTDSTVVETPTQVIAGIANQVIPDTQHAPFQEISLSASSPVSRRPYEDFNLNEGPLSRSFMGTSHSASSNYERESRIQREYNSLYLLVNRQPTRPLNYNGDGTKIDLNGQDYIAMAYPYSAEEVWSMVASEKPVMIVMLASQGADYLPKEGRDLFFGKQQLRVKLLKSEECLGFTKRHVQVSINNEECHLVHYSFKGFPDFGTPKVESFDTLLQDIDQIDMSAKRPIAVHCAGGIGRTGTFIAAHHALAQVKAGNTPDIARIVASMRSQRPRNMVETGSQYLFIHNLVEKVSAKGQVVATSSHSLAPIAKTTQRAAPTSFVLSASMLSNSEEPLVNEFSRLQGIAYPGVESSRYGKSDAHMISLEGKRYIAAAYPQNAESFWKMVHSEKVRVMVQLESKGLSYYPERVGVELIFNHHVRVRLLSRELEGFNIIKRQFQVSFNGEQVLVTHIESGCFAGSFGAPDKKGLEKVLGALDQIPGTAASPVLVHCYGGCGRTGTFIAAHYALNQIRNGSKPNLSEIVVSMRNQRSRKMVETADQYKFLHRLIADKAVISTQTVDASATGATAHTEPTEEADPETSAILSTSSSSSTSSASTSSQPVVVVASTAQTVVLPPTPKQTIQEKVTRIFTGLNEAVKARYRFNPFWKKN